MDEHLTLIFFVTYQMSIGKKSFWYPYFRVAGEADLPMNWDPKDLDFLEDDVLKMLIAEEGDTIRNYYDDCYDIAI